MKSRNQRYQYASRDSQVHDPSVRHFDPRTANRGQRRVHGYTNARGRTVWRGVPVITAAWWPGVAA